MAALQGALSPAKVAGLFKGSRTYSIQEIARCLGLDMEKGSTDRAALGEALNHLVETSVLQERKGVFEKVTAKVARDRRTSKLSRLSNETLVGVVTLLNDGFVVRPANPEQRDVRIDTPNLPEGSIVTVQLADHFNAVAKIIHDHGHMDQDAGLSKLSALSLGIPLEFPEDVMEGVAELKVPRISKNRKDFRHIPFITIDPETAKDFDDAICVRKKGHKWEVMVAIADVSHYVRPDSKLFEEAYRRGNSTYLSDLTIPMLPEELSNGICSLVPNEDRACIVTTMTIDERGNILRHKIERGVIRSIARLNYDQVQNAIEGRPDKETKPLYNKYIKKAYFAYQALLNERMRRGALNLDVMEQRIDISKSGKLTIKVEEGNEAHGMIEELMIAANRCAIKTLIEKDSKFIARVHGKPHESTFRKYIGPLKKLGVTIPADSMPTEEKVRHILRQAEKSPHADEIRRMMIRVQDTACYQTELGEHFGLQLDAYTHKTSPIRRMTDLYIDYLLNAAVLGGNKLPASLLKKMSRAATHFSRTERRSEEAERECKKRIMARWVKGHLGEHFDACVAEVAKGQLSVKVDEPDILTKISVQAGHDYQRGDHVKITPVEADPVTGIIKFIFAKQTESERNVVPAEYRQTKPSKSQRRQLVPA